MRTLIPAALLSCALVAQTDYAFDKATSGTLGSNLDLRFSGAPAGKTLVVMLSATTGPTPLSLLNAGDTRSLSVGLDFVTLWFGQSTGNGSGTISLPVPNDNGLHGAVLHWQTVTVPGSPFVVDKIGNPVSVQFGAAGRSAALAGLLPVARALGTPFPHARNPGGGDFVYAGGGQGSLLGATGLDSSDVYSFRTMTASPGPRMTVARALHVAVPLNDGRVLLIGGADANGIVLRTCELFDPAANTFTPTGQMAIARGGHAAVALADGRVLVAGGTTTFLDPIQALANAQLTTEIWNPATGQWTAGPSIASRRLAPCLVRLQDGRVLLSGGFEVQIIFSLPIPIGSVASCQLLNAAGTAWSAAGSMRQSRAAHMFNTVVLNDGRVLATGGVSSGPDLTQATPLALAEYYTPGTNTWTALPNMASARATHSATVLPSGKVVVAGGATGTISAPTAIAGVQEFDPATNTWRPLPDLTTTRAAHAGFLTPDGLLVLIGGQGGPSNVTLRTMESVH
jgi:hypothetical protein